MGMGHTRDLGEGLEHARRRLAVDDRDQLRPTRPEHGLDGLGLEKPAPLAPHGDDLGAAALGDLQHEQPEAAALADDHAIPGLDQ